MNEVVVPYVTYGDIYLRAAALLVVGVCIVLFVLGFMKSNKGENLHVLALLFLVVSIICFAGLSLDTYFKYRMMERKSNVRTILRHEHGSDGIHDHIYAVPDLCSGHREFLSDPEHTSEQWLSLCGPVDVRTRASVGNVEQDDK